MDVKSQYAEVWRWYTLLPIAHKGYPLSSPWDKPSTERAVTTFWETWLVERYRDTTERTVWSASGHREGEGRVKSMVRATLSSPIGTYPIGTAVNMKMVPRVKVLPGLTSVALLEQGTGWPIPSADLSPADRRAADTLTLPIGTTLSFETLTDAVVQPLLPGTASIPAQTRLSVSANQTVGHQNKQLHLGPNRPFFKSDDNVAVTLDEWGRLILQNDQTVSICNETTINEVTISAEEEVSLYKGTPISLESSATITRGDLRAEGRTDLDYAEARRRVKLEAPEALHRLFNPPKGDFARCRIWVCTMCCFMVGALRLKQFGSWPRWSLATLGALALGMAYRSFIQGIPAITIPLWSIPTAEPPTKPSAAVEKIMSDNETLKHMGDAARSAARAQHDKSDRDRFENADKAAREAFPKWGERPDGALHPDAESNNRVAHFSLTGFIDTLVPLLQGSNLTIPDFFPIFDIRQRDDDAHDLTKMRRENLFFGLHALVRAYLHMREVESDPASQDFTRWANQIDREFIQLAWPSILSESLGKKSR